MTESAETHRFEAETKQILELVIHSLYSERHIFIRELISNASDALDRARYEALHRQDLRPAEGEPGITISTDSEAGTLTITDNGIGMTRAECVENLGTIARSGTRAFAQAATNGNVEGLIGQFGVGFYSAFMVAETVTVDTLSAEPDAEPVRWTAQGGESYTIQPGSRTQRGTEVILTLRDDAKEFLEESTIRDTVRRHSDFVGFPIRLGDDQLNQAGALWARMAKDITDEEYTEFYKHVSNDWEGPAARVHTSSDAPLHLHALLFVPKRRPFDLDHPDTEIGVKLYSRRVLILEHAREIIPRYLRFLRGVVESDDLNLNLSREILQQTSVARKLKQQITKQVLKRLKELARDDKDAYESIWQEYGPTLKEGIHEDEQNKEILSQLLRYETTKGEGLRSLQQVVDEKPAEQDAIWYLTGLDMDRMKASPLLEQFKRRGFEVLLMPDPVDEWVVMSLSEYADVPLKSVAKGEFDDEFDDDPIAEEARKQAQPLMEYLNELFGDELKEVRASGRLLQSPSVLVDSDTSLGHNMERILRAARSDMALSQRILEVNVEHPIVKNLARLQEQGRTATLEPLARLLLDHARLAEGEVRDPSKMVERLQRVMLQASASLTGGKPAADDAAAVPEEPSSGPVEDEAPIGGDEPKGAEPAAVEPEVVEPEVVEPEVVEPEIIDG